MSRVSGGAKKVLSFEVAMARLNEIVKCLESDEIELGQMEGLYKEANSLVLFCRLELEKVSMKISLVNENS